MSSNIQESDISSGCFPVGSKCRKKGEEKGAASQDNALCLSLTAHHNGDYVAFCEICVTVSFTSSSPAELQALGVRILFPASSKASGP